MPTYANPEDDRACVNRFYRWKYRTDPDFAEAEAARKAAWLQTPEGKAKNAAASKRWRARKKKRLAKKRSVARKS